MDRHIGAVNFSYSKKAITQVHAKGIAGNPFNQAYDQLKVNSVLLRKDENIEVYQTCNNSLTLVFIAQKRILTKPQGELGGNYEKIFFELLEPSPIAAPTNGMVAFKFKL